MNEIGVIVNNIVIYDMAVALSKKQHRNVKVVLVHSYEESVACAKEFESQGFRILISRGGHSDRLREAGLSIPIIDIPFMGNNIASLLIQAKKEFGGFGVIGSELLVNTAKELEEAIGGNIRYFEVKTWSDFERLVSEAKSQGIKAIVGGYDATGFAQKEGLTCFTIETCEYEIETAFQETQKVLRILDREKQWNELFKTILDSISEGVISVDYDGDVTHINLQAKKLLSASGSLLLGRPVDVEPLNNKIKNTLKYGTKIYDELNEINDTKFISSMLPVTVDNKTVGGVVVLQEIEYVQKIEQKIRRRLSQRGLVANKAFEDILGSSTAIKETIKKAKQYSVVNSTVLICGESGTGKEMFAQSIHNYSLRKEEAFVAINCATISPNLLESELFGYVEGAFTGAKKGGKVGLFELAHNGTIFLDEIGEISLDMQARLLRVLEEKQIMRVGDDKVIPVNIRIIAATNKDLHKMVQNGEFREDFYYRLNVLSLMLPPLRERKEDLEVLINSFVQRFSDLHNKNMVSITSEGMSLLLDYEWPGNARELKNVIERLVVTNHSEFAGYNEVASALGNVFYSLIPDDKLTYANDEVGLKDRKEKELIHRVLNETEWNKTKAAKRLGISRATLHRKIKQMREKDIQ